MDRLAGMEAFVEVVKHGSISAAADRLDVAKSAISRRLTELEAHLGVQLFQRSTRRMNLTDSGRMYYEHCVRLFDAVEEAEASVTAAHRALRGPLRVALPLTFGILHLAPAILAFLKQHPALEFDLDFNDRRVDILQEGYDVAIRIAQLEDSSLVARRLVNIRHGVYASPAYLKRQGVPETPADLAEHQCLVYSNLATPDVWPYQDRQGRSGTAKVAVRLKANSGDFLLQAARNGEGLILSPLFYLEADLRAGRLVPVLPDYEWPALAAYALYPPTRHLSSRVRAFVDFLVEWFSERPSWDRIDLPAVRIKKNRAPTRKH